MKVQRLFLPEEEFYRACFQKFNLTTVGFLLAELSGNVPAKRRSDYLQMSMTTSTFSLGSMLVHGAL